MGVSSRRASSLSLLLSLLLVVVGAGIASAQTTSVSDPNTLVFAPSPDHNTTLSDGRPVVDHYSFDVYAVGASAPFQSTNIGKPTPSSDGSIYYDFSGQVASWPLPGGSYEARVGAVGPTGSGLSDPSNTFSFTNTSCSYAMTPTSATLPAAGGGTQMSVTTTSSCKWTAVSNVSWVALNTSGATGSATVIATVAANTSSSARTGTLTVAGKTFTVNQQGASCTFTLSPTSASVATAGGTGTVSVTASGTSCGWTAASGASWATLTPTSGTGSGKVTYTASANSGAARSTTLTIAGTAFGLSQAGTTASAPSAASSPNPASGATAVTTGSTLTWTCSGATSYTVRLGTSSTPSQVASGLTTASYKPASLAANTKYYWQIVAVNATGSTASPVWSFTTASSTTTALPSPWVQADIGSVGLAGSATSANGAFTVVGAGADIWGTADAFHYLYQPLTGHTQIATRVTSENAANALAKAGVMMREGSAGMVPGAAHVTLTVRPDGTVELVTRATAGGSTTLKGSKKVSLPISLRLVRSGSTVTGSVSTNGSTWTTIGSATLALTSKAQVGLAVNSHDVTQRNTTSFASVTVK